MTFVQLGQLNGRAGLFSFLLEQLKEKLGIINTKVSELVTFHFTDTLSSLSESPMHEYSASAMHQRVPFVTWWM